MPEQLEERLAYLEAEVAKLKSRAENNSPSIPCWEKIAGTFADNPNYDEAIQLGREYRESLRPDVAEPNE
jgi:hypothetical protein